MGHLAVGIGPVANYLTEFWKPIPHIGVPCLALVRGEEFSSTTARYGMLS